VIPRSFRCLSPALAALFVGVVATTLRVDAETEQTRQITIVQDLAPIGVAFGQTLRYTWANTTQPGETRVFEPLRVSARLLAGDGSVLAQATADPVGAGEFQSFDFARAAIAASGNPSTGRLQLRVEATIVGNTKYLDIVLKRGITRLFHHAVELVDDVTGHTSVSMGGGFNELSMDDTAGKEKSFGKPDTFQILSAGRDGLIGIVPGQSLRLSASNPAPARDDRRFKMLFAFTVLDASGAVIAQGDEVTLEPGQSHSFDVPYSELAGAGAEITGRVQVRTEMRRHFPGIVQRFSSGGTDAPASLELVDAGTGRTVMLISSKPKEIVVVGSKCCEP
jgi:hypothetical protein